MEVTFKLVSGSRHHYPQTTAQEFQPPIKDSTIEIKPLLYLHLNLNLLLSQRLGHHSMDGPVLTYLSIRMPSLSEPIDTPPVLYHQSFVDNAAITSHADMKYTFTLPILTAENSSQKSKLIVEVWHIISPLTSEVKNSETGPSLPLLNTSRILRDSSKTTDLHNCYSTAKLLSDYHPMS